LILIVPKIDPKQKLKLMGNKLFKIKLFLTLIMSILSLFIIEASRNESLENPNYIYLFLGILFIVLGNYSKTIKHNYFIGIRTPWTLENETVWNETHKLGGKFWFIGGMLIVFSSLILGTQINKIFTISVISIITLIPVIYSYFAFKRIQNEK
jgi:uncharacterized membrane protein